MLRRLKDWLAYIIIRKRVAMRHCVIDKDVAGRILRHPDYVRQYSLALALTRIREEQIKGNLAEVGVYRGEISALIHSLCPERMLYLYDTFEGFPDREKRADHRFSDTNIATVQKAVGGSKNVKIVIGRVPETFSGWDGKQFAFVLLDLDLYEPTMKSLEFFYPRMSPGGFLIVHDYNNPESDWACHRALDEFLIDKPESLIEWPDCWGSAVFRKQKHG